MSVFCQDMSGLDFVSLLQCADYQLRAFHCQDMSGDMSGYACVPPDFRRGQTQ